MIEVHKIVIINGKMLKSKHISFGIVWRSRITANIFLYQIRETIYGECRDYWSNRLQNILQRNCKFYQLVNFRHRFRIFIDNCFSPHIFLFSNLMSVTMSAFFFFNTTGISITAIWGKSAYSSNIYLHLSLMWIWSYYHWWRIQIYGIRSRIRFFSIYFLFSRELTSRNFSSSLVIDRICLWKISTSMQGKNFEIHIGTKVWNSYGETLKFLFGKTLKSLWGRIIGVAEYNDQQIQRGREEVVKQSRNH